MHYLAHIYLSGSCPKTLVGSFIKEVKPSWNYSKYNSEYIKGIYSHNIIDEFSDNHPIIKRSQKRFSKSPELSKKILYILFDHLLAANWKSYSCIPLEKFTSDVNKILIDHISVLPFKVRLALPQIIQLNWLAQYKTMEGINNAIKEFGKIYLIPYNTDSAMADFINNYTDFKNDFNEFFPLLIAHVKSKENLRDNLVRINVSEEIDFIKNNKKESLRLKIA